MCRLGERLDNGRFNAECQNLAIDIFITIFKHEKGSLLGCSPQTVIFFASTDKKQTNKRQRFSPFKKKIYFPEMSAVYIPVTMILTLVRD